MGNIDLALEQFDTVIKNTLGKLCVALLSGNRVVHQNLQTFWSYLLFSGLLNQFLHQCSCALCMTLEHLDTVLKHTLGKSQIALLGSNGCVSQSLSAFLGDFDQVFSCFVCPISVHIL